MPGTVVAAEHWRGAEVGAGILARGGNAVDAAVATAFAMTVVEPFMSTIAGSGTMLVHLARKDETVALNFNGGRAAGRPRDPVQGRQRLLGRPLRVAAHRRTRPTSTGTARWRFPARWPDSAWPCSAYGTMELRDVIAPAIALARDGFETDWYLALNHAKSVEELMAFPGPRRPTLRDGRSHLPAGRHAAGRSLGVPRPGAAACS